MKLNRDHLNQIDVRFDVQRRNDISPGLSGLRTGRKAEILCGFIISPAKEDSCYDTGGSVRLMFVLLGSLFCYGCCHRERASDQCNR